MEGEHQVTIPFFHGQQTEDGKSWLERFEYYVRYRTLNEQKQSDVFPVLMKDALVFKLTPGFHGNYLGLESCIQGTI